MFDLKIVLAVQKNLKIGTHIANKRKRYGLGGGQTASEVVFDLRFEFLDLKNLWIHTHIAIIGHSP